MKLLNIYQNFLLRNLIVFVFFILIIFSSVYYDFYTDAKNSVHSALSLLGKIAIGTFPIFCLMLCSNIFLIKGFFINKKYYVFIAVFILYWFFAHYLLNQYFEYFFVGKNLTVLSTVTAVISGTGVYFLHLWIERNIAEGRKESISVESELSFLKQQLNPHFLLNAMNNLYGESLAAPENLPDRILNLSDMLRYQIEATKKNLVPLQEEVAFIKRYIEYYAFRNDRLIVQQEYIGTFENIQIPPLFFLPLVENAIKFSGETASPVIVLELAVSENQLSFSIRNNFLNEGSRLESTGIGIENLERRLEVYGFKHEFVYGRKKDLFNIKLKIWGLFTAA